MNKNVKMTFKALIVLTLSFVMGMMLTSKCQAESRYAGNYDKCISDLSAYASIESVQQACHYAETNQNGCSLWIGSSSSATIPEITAYSKTGTVPISFWGLCTDRVDTARSVNVTNDGDSINDNINITRRIRTPGYASSTLDVAKFINGASEQKVSQCETRYTRTVTVARTHSDGASTNQMDQVVTLRVLDGEGCNTDTGKQTCDAWVPASYMSSGPYRGTTTLDFRVRNRTMADLFGNVKNAAWDKVGPVYAMPTDTIEWVACYYPGVQKTWNTNVTSLNDEQLGYTIRPRELPTDRCIALIQVSYEALYVKVNRVSKWENKLDITGDVGEYHGVWGMGESKIQKNIISYKTTPQDVGHTFTETAKTGTPETAVITQSWPATDFFGCTCVNRWCADEGSSSDSDDDDDDDNNSDEGCRDPREEFYECSCCTSYNIYSGPAYSTGHLNTYTNRLADATVTFGPIEKSLSAKVQYNFTTSTAVSIRVDNDKDVVYAGSQSAVVVESVVDNTISRDNKETLRSYTTIVPNAETYLYTYVTADSDGGGIGGPGYGDHDVCNYVDAKQCVQLEYDKRDLNASGELGGFSDEIWGESNDNELVYNAFDASAGDWMCFASSLSPSGVSGETDMYGSNGDWTFSVPACVVIAKKPIFQVWGGSVYSAGNIIAGYNSKVNIYTQGYEPNGGTPINFMSWVEESLVMRDGLTNSLASGAASALNNNAAGVGTSVTFCNEGAALSFANYSNMIGSFCNGVGGVGQSGIDSGITNREDLIQYWVGTGASAAMNTMPGASLNLSNPNSVGQAISSATGNTVRYAYSAGDINLSGTVPQGTTYLIRSEGAVNITGNLEYNNTGTSFAQIPKVIIYAQNVNISCSVSEVDAIIVTKTNGTVDTCAESPDSSDENNYDNDPRRERLQLKIFGLVITDNIKLKRTYGAAANEDGQRTDSHGIPSDGAAAEIFDYDSSILMWSEFMAGSAESDTLQTVYQHELAPRY